MVYNRFKIHGYQYILNCIDTNSRYVASRALTNMKLKESTRGGKAVTLLDAVKSIMEELGYPKELRCDNQFISSEFVQLMKDHNVKVVYSEMDDLIKNSLVESFNRTLAGMLQKWRLSTGNKEWYKGLQSVIKKYNNTIHGTINEKPSDVWNYKAVNHQEITRITPKYKVNDKVRIITNKKTFGKSDAVRNSKTIYTIVEEVGNKFKLQNMESKEILRRLYSPRNLVKVTEIEEVNEIIEPPAEDKNEEKFKTPIRSRKDRNKKVEEPKKFIGATKKKII